MRARSQRWVELQPLSRLVQAVAEARVDTFRSLVGASEATRSHREIEHMTHPEVRPIRFGQSGSTSEPGHADAEY